MIKIGNFREHASVAGEISGDPELSIFDAFDELFKHFLEIIDCDLDGVIAEYQSGIEEITEEGRIINICHIAEVNYMPDKNGIFFQTFDESPFAIFFNNEETYNKFEVLIETTDVFELKGIEKKNK